MNFRETFSWGPRYLDVHHAASVRPATLTAYQRAVQHFLDYLDENGWDPRTPEEFDDLLVEWTFDKEPSLSRIRFAYAAIEFFFPRMRGRLTWTKDRVDVLQRRLPVKHAIPAGYETCVLLGAKISSMGRPRIGLAPLVQVVCGFRPGELLGLRPIDVAISPDPSKSHCVVIRVGAGRGT